MASKDADLLLVGAGLANTLIALRLVTARPDLRVTMIDSAAELGGDRTWSFHESDLTPAQNQWIAQFVDHRWESYQVRFPGYHRQLSGRYCCIESRSFFLKARPAVAHALRLGSSVESVSEHAVTLSTGERLTGRVVLDGRGPRPSASLELRLQKFVGQVLRLTHPHGLTAPMIMDAAVPQTDGFRFLYTLPLDATRLLVEDTYYADEADMDAASIGYEIEAYARDQGWQVAAVEREERGALPIVLGGDLEAYLGEARSPETGLRGLLFHATTGYSLPSAIAVADSIATARDTASIARIVRGAVVASWKRQRYFRMLNRVLFLAAKPEQRRALLEHFYRLPEPLIARFYAGTLRPADMARILIGRPPVSIRRALSAMPPRAAGGPARAT